MVSKSLLEFASKNYHFDIDTLKYIGDPTKTNQTYTFTKDGKEYVLKFARRPIEQIRQTKAEMNWIYYLGEKNIGVSLPFKTNKNELVIATLENGENFINWGKLMGNMHRLTKDYTPASEYKAREIYNGLYWGSFFDCLKTNPSLYKIAEGLQSEIMTLPKDKDSFGLIHCDMHQWNFYIDGDKINVFDFDDSLYGWFALDIGIALFHALWWGRKDDARNDYTNSIIENFLKGYLSANHLSDFWISKIPMFMRYRQICSFIPWFFNPENIDDNQKEWIYNIENDILFTDCEIKSLFEKS